ncbi:MAG: Fic family protein [Bacteroidales bacterium]|nr:Fic family protein [Bacteroidales bacterium]
MNKSLPELPPSVEIQKIETRVVLKKLATTHAALAELKGISSTIPNQQILIDTLSLQEAKDSSAIENIVTTQDEIYRSNYSRQSFSTAAAKEVHRYAEALKTSYRQVKENGFISMKMILSAQEVIEQNKAGIRKLPGTVLKNDLTGELVYTPPQRYDTIMALLDNLEKFINGSIPYDVDPLVKMAIIHIQFESIHPFYDGNGRTGRILNILYLINEGLLDLPILYISRFIIRNRMDYYRLLQDVREQNTWEAWILYILDAIETTAGSTVETIKGIKRLMLEYKSKIRKDYPKMYSQDLINNLFRHPYTRIGWLEKDLGVTRLTARKYLETLMEQGLLKKIKAGRNNYYINPALLELLVEGNATG